MSETPTPKVYAAIAAVEKAMAEEGIAKGRKNQQQGYQYRGIDEVMNALSPVLAENRLCIMPRVINREVEERTSAKGAPLFYVTVTAEFDFVSAEDASKHTCSMYGEAMDSGDKATGKAMSYAYRDVCLKVFCIPTQGDHDTDATTHELQGKTNGQANGARPAPPTQAAGPQAPAVAQPVITDADVQAIREVLVAVNLSEEEACWWVSSHRTRVLAELTGPEGVRLFNQYRKK